MEPDNVQPTSLPNVDPTVEPLSLAPPETGNVGTGPINLAPVESASAVPPTPPLAEKRTAQVQFGLGEVLKKPSQEVYDMFAQGRESQLRSEAVSILDEDLHRRRESLMMDYLKNKKEPLTLQELTALTNRTNDMYKGFDVQSVIEKAYANRYLSSLDTAADYMKTSAINDANREIPEQMARLNNLGNVISSKIMFANKVKDDIENEIGSQGYVSWGVDQFKNIFQPYVEYKMRGNVPGVGSITGGLLLGDNLKAQADKIFLLPEEQYQSELTRVSNYLKKDNPTLAREFVDYVIGKSLSERELSNFFTVLAPMDYYGIAKGGLSLARKASVYNRASTAVKDQVKSLENLGKGVPDAAVAAEGAGNVVEAGTVRAAQHITESIEGRVNPIKDVKESLTSNFRLDGEAFDKNPGKLSRENLVRIKNSFADTGDKLWNAITTAARVNRTPLPLASEDAVRAYQESMKRKFPGMQNQIVDISSPRYEPASNTNWVDFTVVNQNGALFSNAETAANYARSKGFTNVQVVEGKGAVQVADEGFAGSKTDLNNKTRLEQSIPAAEAAMRKWNREARKKDLTPEAKAEAKQQADFFKKTAKDYKEQLEAINKRVVATPARIEQDGAGFKIVITRPYKETDDTVREFLIADEKARSTATQEGFANWRSAAIGWIRGANDTLSYNETVQRLKATYSQSVLQQWANDEAKKLSDVAAGLLKRDPVTGAPIPWYLSRPRAFLGKFTGGDRQMFKEFNQTLEFARTDIDPIKGGDPGYFKRTPGELDDHYMRFYGRTPTLPEYEAYFAHVKLTEGDRVFREIAEFRNRARIGTEQHQLFFRDEKNQRVSSGFFDAIHQSEFPGGKDDQILIMGARKGEEKLHNLGGISISPQQLAKYKEDVLQGRAKIFRIYDPDSHPLREFSDIAGNERIRYVLTTDSETKPLEFNHVNRRGGGHFEYDHDHYLKQARVIAQSGQGTGTDKRTKFQSVYTGDTTVMALDNRIMGKDIAKKLDNIREMIKKSVDPDQIDAAIKRDLFMEPDEVKGWFKPGRDPNGKVIPPRLDLDEPFYVVPKNRKIYDLDKSLEDRYKGTWVDGTKKGSDAQQFQVSYTMQRDADGLKRLQDVGSQGNPVYQWVPAKLVDPIPTMNRALNRAIQSTFMDDYKMYAVEHWLAEAMPHLKAPESEVRASPFWHFNNPDFKNNPENQSIVWNLKANQQKINQFVGTPNTFDTWVHGATQNLTDAFYRSFGPEDSRSLSGKAVTLTPLWLLNRVKDPIQAIRSFTFNAKLGLFNPVQFIVQAQGHAAVFALEPRHGSVGTFGALLHQWSRVNSNPEVLKAMDNYYTKMSMFGSRAKPGEFLEARKVLASTGFEHVAGEYSMADDLLQHKFIKNDFGNFLDAGQVFFREGEKSVRMTAWYTAFRKFRQENPVGAISKADVDKILYHADLLTNNMSRASASTLHTGVFSPSTQFLSFQLRQAELFLGKRLGETTAERMAARARLVSFYAGLYGIPSAVGVSGFPFGDSIREYAINNGYVVGENYLSSLAIEGVPAVLGAMIEGGGDMQKGTIKNVGNRYGAQGITPIKNLFSDVPMWKTVGGAGASTAVDTWTSLSPFWKYARSLVSPDEDGNHFNLTPSDFLGPLTVTATGAGAKRLIEALNTGRWLNRNEQYIQDVTAADALFRTITGLTDQMADDQYKMYEMKKAEEAELKEATKEITKAYQRGIEAMKINDNDTAQKMFKNVRMLIIKSGMSNSMASEVLANASRGWEDQISRGNWNFGMDPDTPTDKQQIRQDRLERQLKLEEKKRQ